MFCLVSQSSSITGIGSRWLHVYSWRRGKIYLIMVNDRNRRVSNPEEIILPAATGHNDRKQMCFFSHLIWLCFSTEWKFWMFQRRFSSNNKMLWLCLLFLSRRSQNITWPYYLLCSGGFLLWGLFQSARDTKWSMSWYNCLLFLLCFKMCNPSFCVWRKTSAVQAEACVGTSHMDFDGWSWVCVKIKVNLPLNIRVTC